MPKTSPDAPDGGRTLTFHDLIIIAVEALGGGRKGSSVQAIKKHILVQYGVEVSVKNNHHFKRGLETALEEESLIRVTGVGGAIGSFRLPSKSNKKSPPTAGNATTRTTRKKSPPTNVDDVTSAMNNMAVRATEQPGTSTGATNTRAKGKMVADDPGKVPSTRKLVMNAAIADAGTPPPSSSKGKNKNFQPAAATSRKATAKTQPVTSRPTAVKAPSSTSSAAGERGKQKNEIQLPKINNGPPRKLPAKAAVPIQKKPRRKALVLSEESEDDEEPEVEDMDDENNNSTKEPIKPDDQDSEEDPAVSEDENETNGTLIPPPSSSASHRSANEEVASDSEESTDGEGEHNETGASGTTGSALALYENPSSLDSSRHDRSTESSIDMGGSDQMNSLTEEAPTSRDSNMTSSTTNTQERQGEVESQVGSETTLDEYQSDTTVYDDDNESDVSQIDATKYVHRANQDSTQTEDEEEQETDNESTPGNETATDVDVKSVDQVAIKSVKLLWGMKKKTRANFVEKEEDPDEDQVATEDEAGTEDQVSTGDPNTDDEDEESEDEESEDDESEDEGTGSEGTSDEGMEGEGSAADDEDED